MVSSGVPIILVPSKLVKFLDNVIRKVNLCFRRGNIKFNCLTVLDRIMFETKLTSFEFKRQ